jgi:membrane-associated phospholipid phosphatase
MKAALALLLLLSAAASAEEERKFLWDDRPKFRRSEAVVTVLALGAAAGNFYLVRPPVTPVWRGPILFDQPARNAMLIGSQKSRDQVKVLADILVIPLMGYAMLDGPITARWKGRNKETALQLALINAETFAVVEALNLTIANTLPRSRPAGEKCDPESKYDTNCVKSFWSGHAANAFTSASLVCAEHGAFDLYGGKADAVACGGALFIAAVGSASRITSNNHHASDVIVGAMVGGVAGYLMPNLLHFKARKAANKLGWLIPSVSPNGGGLAYVKTW